MGLWKLNIKIVTQITLLVSKFHARIYRCSFSENASFFLQNCEIERLMPNFQYGYTSTTYEYSFVCIAFKRKVIFFDFNFYFFCVICKSWCQALVISDRSVAFAPDFLRSLIVVASTPGVALPFWAGLRSGKYVVWFLRRILLPFARPQVPWHGSGYSRSQWLQECADQRHCRGDAV